MEFYWHDIVGTLGTALVVLGYFLIQSGRLTAEDLAFSLINLGGACLLMISLWFNFNLASVIIECFWIAISLMGIGRYCRQKFRPKSLSQDKA
ncbi:hypothetical protein HMF8227_00103 [Saliniradius amylolyticus]|uniref:CBU-0592-like domain-containing protein n=1 Tax=Saliniradius amylolyticus TaxID=2183582 RepID=A0A2S2DYY2_9ALTE|nr:hypothetical protein [Saliniradius amylolyticus]AWL10611.1 hypothetical protein HMF8227_00103 [Saliniradius amylolyticus]